jgi:hypothetical protein
MCVEFCDTNVMGPYITTKTNFRNLEAEMEFLSILKLIWKVMLWVD